MDSAIGTGTSFMAPREELPQMYKSGRSLKELLKHSLIVPP